jgi:hypothetical protein
MTKEQQIIAIAEACGWADCIYIESLGLCKGKHENSRVEYDSGHSSLPDYLNDLNAIHEAEKVLTEDQRIAYSDHTYDIACEEQDTTGNWRWLSLTATQRAEAFLRTLGKWEEAQ